MSIRERQAVRRVLKEAAEHERFFDYNDAERLTFLLTHAYRVGRQQRRKAAVNRHKPSSR